eukprot:TRINITY_DN52610_c0_g1_i1.p1 TRINITY_DN52610_c0_g1~~TRINITY_DN52610_c0_g1_i1.p1  ORF type:complete len:287 (-),score=31.35 TRINITY_DN52610_c0_g1_i1:13-828(-)
MLLRGVTSALLVHSVAGDEGSCWQHDFTWFSCCRPSLGPEGNTGCWAPPFSFERCCLSSPELEPLLSDLESCAADPYVRIRIMTVPDEHLGGHKGCYTTLACRASPVDSLHQLVHKNTVCEDEFQTLEESAYEYACNSLGQLPVEERYSKDDYESVRHRYRFGTVERPHCAVPNWRFLREEPLRFYFLMERRLKLSKILINIGSGDASFDDPLGPILSEFSSASAPWRGVFFDGIPENCEKASSNLRGWHGEDVQVVCGFVTPDKAVNGIC